MKILKIGTVLGVLATAIMGSLWVLDVVKDAEAVESLKRILGVIAILTLSSGAIVLISGKKEGK